jgi:hypothetical protein
VANGDNLVWRNCHDRMIECFFRIAAEVGTFGEVRRGDSDSDRPYRFNVEQSYFDAVTVVVSFAGEADDHVRYSARLEDSSLARKALATGPAGLIDVRGGLAAAAADIDAALDQIIAFLEASTRIIKRADPTRPPGLSDVIAEFRRFLTS